MIKSLINKVLSKSKIYENERSSNNKKTFLYKYAHAKDKSRYVFARKFIKGNNILNISCGEGHGSAILLQDNNSTIYGLDISEEAIAHAKVNFKNKNLEFYIGDACKMPFKNNFFTSIISIETIEHLKDHNKFLLELKRVLKKDGVLVVSSPDKIVEDKFFDNPHHISLLYKEDLLKLLEEYFEVVGIYCQTPIIKKPFFMIYLSFIFSSIFLSKKIVNNRANLTGTNCIFFCRKT